MAAKDFDQAAPFDIWRAIVLMRRAVHFYFPYFSTGIWSALVGLLLMCALQETAKAERCLQVVNLEVVPSTESQEALKGACPIRKCFGQSCSCYDSLHRSEVTNTCDTSITETDIAQVDRSFPVDLAKTMSNLRGTQHLVEYEVQPTRRVLRHSFLDRASSAKHRRALAGVHGSRRYVAFNRGKIWHGSEPRALIQFNRAFLHVKNRAAIEIA